MIGVVIDTNIINSGSKDYMVAQFSNKLDDIIRALEANDNYQDIKILLPQIVVQELYQHQLSNYNKEIERLKGLKLPDLEFIPKEDYSVTLNRLFDESLTILAQRDLQTEVISYTKNEMLPNIINRAIMKQAPFEGEDKNSDKGFKDVILWESALEYKRQHLDDTLILFTNDKRLCATSLNEEYKSLFSEDIYLVQQEKGNDYSKLYDQISRLAKNNKPIKNTFDEDNKQRLLNLISEQNVSYMFEGQLIETEERSFTCARIYITSKSIIDIIDYPDNKKTEYIVRVDVSIHSHDKEKEDVWWDDFVELTIDYYFEDDIFYLQRAFGFNGDWEYEEKGYQLLEE